MLRNAMTRRTVGRLGLIALLGSLSAGCGSDHQAMRRPGAADGAYVVQRPAYPVQGTKPLFIGGYAGASYGPGQRGGR